MTNVLIAAPIYSDAFTGNLYTPTISGGSWTGGNPLANMQDRALWKFARSTNDTRATSTLFTADLGANRAVRCVALAGHTISDVAPTLSPSTTQVRVRGFTAPPILDAGGDGYEPFAAGWTPVGTPTRGANVALASNGVHLDLIGDDDGAATEYYYRNVTYTGDGQKVVEMYWKAGTSPSTLATVYLYDSIAATARLYQRISNSAGVPSVTQTVGTLLSSTAIGNGVYRLVFLSTSVTAANTNVLEMYPAESTVADTGNVYIGNVCTFNSATDPLVYDSGMVAAHPSGTTSEDRRGMPATFTQTMPTATARYWRVNINDDNNPAGYIDIGRLVIAGAYEPSVNFTTGADITHESDSVTQYTRGGSAVHDTRPLRRVTRFTIANIEDAEAIGQVVKLSRQMGAHGQCLVVLRPDATASIVNETTFLAVPREQTRIEYPYAMYRNAAFAFTEEL